MNTATEHANQLFMRVSLSDDLEGYPAHLAVVASDIGDTARFVREHLDEGMPTVVVDDGGGETLISPLSRVERMFDRLRQRERVRVGVRRLGDVRFGSCGRKDWAAVERELAL